jgi:hypothetical protein
MIGADILNIGSSKWSQKVDNISDSIQQPEAGFTLPAVPNVRFFFPHIIFVSVQQLLCNFYISLRNIVVRISPVRKEVIMIKQ